MQTSSYFIDTWIYQNAFVQGYGVDGLAMFPIDTVVLV